MTLGPPPRRPAILALLLALPLGACSDPDVPGLVANAPEIAVAPDRVDFGDQAVPVPVGRTFFVSNGGRADLELTMSLVGDDAGVFSLPVTAATLAPDEDVEVEVRFQPATYLEYDAELVILSNDVETPETVVPLTGVGVEAPVPDIRVDPLTLDFGDTASSATEILTVTNVGTDVLSLGTVAQAGSGRFSLVTDPSDVLIGPGDSYPIVVAYDPEGDDGDSGSLTIPSDDPDEGEVEVLFLGNGGADYDYPIAEIDCPGVVAPPTFVTLDGRASRDPEGFTPLAHEWTLTDLPRDAVSGQPTSSGYLTSAVGDTTRLWADAAGRYEVELVVENARGTRSAPARCVVDAIPDEELVVELTWSTPNADLDLHLRQDGTPLFAEPTDANFCNPNPSWFEAGTADDPRLALDDRAGFGPEVIHIDQPSDGRYVIAAHYFEDQGDDTVTATVKVWVRGVEAFTASKNLTRNQVWDVARVNWPEETVAVLSGAVEEAPRRSCFTP